MISIRGWGGESLNVSVCILEGKISLKLPNVLHTYWMEDP